MASNCPIMATMRRALVLGLFSTTRCCLLIATAESTATPPDHSGERAFKVSFVVSQWEPGAAVQVDLKLASVRSRAPMVLFTVCDDAATGLTLLIL